MFPFKSLLVIAPHADDEVLGCGGLVARMRRLNLDVQILIVNPEHNTRIEEASISSNILGVENIIFGEPYPEGLDTVPQRKLIKLIENAINDFVPEAVAIPDLGAAHQDHRAVGLASISACRPAGMTQHYRPPIVLGWEEAADAWAPRPMQTPGLTITLDQYDIDKKIDAMLAHSSQVRSYPSERSVEAIEALARVRGTQAGVEYGEAYNVLRWLV